MMPVLLDEREAARNDVRVVLLAEVVDFPAAIATFSPDRPSTSNTVSSLTTGFS
jgi:hypothetical protein